MRASSSSSIESEVSHRWTSSAGSSNIEIDELDFRESIDNREPSDTRQKTEAARARRSRIHDETIPFARNDLTVGVSVDENVLVVSGKQFLRRRYAELVAVADVNAEPANLEHQREGEIRIAHWICIAAHCFDGSDLSELLENSIADIAGVNDQLGTFERAADSGSQEPVSIGNESDCAAIRRIGHCALNYCSEQTFASVWPAHEMLACAN